MHTPSTLGPMLRGFLLAGALGVLGCSSAFVPRAEAGAVRTQSLCEPDGIERLGVGGPRACHTCATDDDCVFRGNVCEGVVYCSHRDAVIDSTALGCHPEPRPPDGGGCVCRGSYCQAR